MKINFANIQYDAVAPFVGLRPTCDMRNIPTFDLHRSRIPTPLLKSIVQSIDLMLVQYGPVVEHFTEETTSQFLSPVSTS